MHLHKLMAYKDEYEVARLLLSDDARAGYEAVGGPDTVVTYHLHPPMLRAIGSAPRSFELRRTARPALRTLPRPQGRARHSARPVPMGAGTEIRIERAMTCPEYVEALRRVQATLDAATLDDAVRDRLPARPGPRLPGPQAAPRRRLPSRNSPRRLP